MKKQPMIFKEIREVIEVSNGKLPETTKDALAHSVTARIIEIIGGNNAK